MSNQSKVKCPQIEFITKVLEGQEDCLLLNVYVPDMAFSSIPKKIPVMVCIIYRREQYFTHPVIKHYNDLLDRQSSEWSMNELTKFYVGDFFVYTLALSTLDYLINIRPPYIKRPAYYIGLFGYYIKNYSLFNNHRIEQKSKKSPPNFN